VNVIDPAPEQRWRQAGTLIVVVLAVNLLAWGVLLGLVVPHHLKLGTKVFGVGLGVTAYTLGMRHAFDADHIAAIDNTTRKLLADGKRPVSAGFWFALGHSTIVLLLAAVVAAGAQVVSSVSGDSGAHHVLGVLSTGLSGLFLYLIGILNLISLAGIARLYRDAKAGQHNGEALEEALNRRGVANRLLRPLLRSVRHPAQMYPIGLLFGLGFDTVTEVGLLVVAGGAAASALPWWAILTLPVLFAAGMSLLDSIDGSFMNFAYGWAFAKPVRKIYYNITVTSLSVAVALVIGVIELVSILTQKLDITSGPLAAVGRLDLQDVGFWIVGLFVVTWLVSLAVWRIGRIEERWSPPGARPAVEPARVHD
jgi:high-affinity nickel-transport protein